MSEFFWAYIVTLAAAAAGIIFWLTRPAPAMRPAPGDPALDVAVVPLNGPGSGHSAALSVSERRLADGSAYRTLNWRGAEPAAPAAPAADNNQAALVAAVVALARQQQAPALPAGTVDATDEVDWLRDQNAQAIAHNRAMIDRLLPPLPPAGGPS